MKRKIITTVDGSKTIQIEEWNEQYHSVHGAINEANHVYIKHGLLFCFEESDDNNISILEMGFGTGLNTFLTLLEAEKRKLNINYIGIEAYPVLKEEIEVLNYVELISPKHKNQFQRLHDSTWDKTIQI